MAKKLLKAIVVLALPVALGFGLLVILVSQTFRHWSEPELAAVFELCETAKLGMSVEDLTNQFAELGATPYNGKGARLAFAIKDKFSADVCFVETESNGNGERVAKSFEWSPD